MALTKINNNTLSEVTTLPSAIATGKVLQVVSTSKSSVSSINTNSDTFVDVTGMSVAITPSSTSSKILVQASVFYSLADNTYGSLCGLRIARDTTGIGTGGQDYTSGTIVGHDDTSSLFFATVPLLFLDSPSTTSAKTYKIQVKNSIGGSKTFYVNGRKDGTNYGSSTITVMEIAG